MHSEDVAVKILTVLRLLDVSLTDVPKMAFQSVLVARGTFQADAGTVTEVARGVAVQDNIWYDKRHKCGVRPG